MLKGTKLYSIITGACPKCQQESMYANPNPYALTQVLEINEKCSHCGTRYRLEPSFFYGSMYVSYGVGVAFAIAAFIISYFIFDSSPLTGFLTIVITLVLLGPIIMRLSRNIWINMFMSYDKQLAKKSKS